MTPLSNTSQLLCRDPIKISREIRIPTIPISRNRRNVTSTGAHFVVVQRDPKGANVVFTPGGAKECLLWTGRLRWLLGVECFEEHSLDSLDLFLLKGFLFGGFKIII